MPKEITLDDGTTQTVYEESEVEGFKTTAEKADKVVNRMTELREELGLKEGESATDKLNEMKEAANPNFAKYRAKYKAMESDLKKGGKEYDEDGNSIQGQKPVSMEEIEKMAQSATQKALFTEKRDALLKTVISDDDRKVVENYLTKLEAIGGDLNENFDLAVTKAFPDRSQDQIRASMAPGAGGVPRINSNDGKSKDFTETDEGKELLESIAPTPKNKKD